MIPSGPTGEPLPATSDVIMHDLAAVLRAAIQEVAPDPRMAIVDLRLEDDAVGLALRGETTLPELVETILQRCRDAAGDLVVRDDVVRLPDPALGRSSFGVVRAAIAPVHAEPRIVLPQVSQCPLGRRLELLSRSAQWWRVRGDDGYIGWVHDGYLVVGDADWASAWERGEGGEPAVALGADLVDQDGDCIARLPWGARVLREQPGYYRLPDGRLGRLGAGEIVDAYRLRDRFPCRAESIVRSARRWLAAPYLWGGVTPVGTDCSGFVQAVYRMHGVSLPRDSDQQAGVGETIMVAGDVVDYSMMRPADLLFFSERGEARISHVAISAGGSQIIHAALSNGQVALNDLAGTLPLEEMLRANLVRVNRILPG